MAIYPSEAVCVGGLDTRESLLNNVYMVVIHFGNTLVQAAKFQKKLFGAHVIANTKEFPLTETEPWRAHLTDLVKKKDVYATLPDSDTHIFRFEMEPQEDKQVLNTLVLEKVKALLPIPIEQVSYDIGVFQKDGSDNLHVLFMGVASDVVYKYYNGLKEIGANPILLVPESLAIYEIIHNKIGQDDAVLMVNATENVSTFSFFDKLGPLSTDTKAVNLEKMALSIEKEIDDFRARFEKEVKIALIGGPAENKVDAQAIRSKTNVNTTTIDWVVKDKLDDAKIKYSSDSFYAVNLAHLAGTALFTYQKNPLNLLSPDTIDSFAKGAPPKTPKAEIKELEKETKKSSDAKAREDKETKETEEAKAEEKTEKKEEEEAKEEPGIETIGAVTPRPESAPPGDAYEEQSGSKIKTIGLVVLGLLVGAGLGYFVLNYFNINLSATFSKPTPTPTQAPTPTATPTPVAVDRSKVTLQVLNGSGERGAAAAVADPLEEKGYPDIDTGNADNYDYEGTTIQIADDNDDLKATLLMDLNLKESEVTFEDLPEDSDYDAIIIVGK